MWNLKVAVVLAYMLGSFTAFVYLDTTLGNSLADGFVLNWFALTFVVTAFALVAVLFHRGIAIELGTYTNDNKNV